MLTQRREPLIQWIQVLTQWSEPLTQLTQVPTSLRYANGDYIIED
ncbi:MAG: hypothetical protein ACHQNT_10600 [Bacteroidia bacterium]